MVVWLQQKKMLLVVLAFALGQASLVHAAKVAVSIQPWGLLVAELMGHADSEAAAKSIDVIVPKGASPHHFHLRHSTRQQIDQAGLVIWSGERLEPFLAKIVAGLPAEKVLDISTLPVFKQKKQTGEEVDIHSWLNPSSMEPIAEAVAARLTQLKPQHSQKIKARLAAFKQDTKKLDKQSAQQLKAVQSIGFFVYHNAFDELVNRYGLNQMGVVQPNPERRPSVRHRLSLEQKKAAAVCLFGELELDHGNGAELAAEWQLEFVQLDHLGSQLTLGEHRYRDLIDAIIQPMLDCLSQRQEK